MQYLKADFTFPEKGPMQTRLQTKLARPESLQLKPTLTDALSSEGPTNQFPTGTLQNTIQLLTDSQPYSATSTPTGSSHLSSNPMQPSISPSSSSLMGFQPSQTAQTAPSSLVAAATQSTLTQFDKQPEPNGAFNSRLIIGTIVGGVLGLFTCIIAVYCILNNTGRARRRRRQLQLSRGNSFGSSEMSITRPWSELDHIYDRELDEIVPHAQAPASFDPSPFPAEYILRINPATNMAYGMEPDVTRSGPQAPAPPPRARLSPNGKTELVKGQPLQYYQVKLRPDIKPARKAPLPPPLRGKHIDSELIPARKSSRNITQAARTPSQTSLAPPTNSLRKHLSKISRRQSHISQVSSVYSKHDSQEGEEGGAQPLPFINEPSTPKGQLTSPSEEGLYDDGQGDYPILPSVEEIPSATGTGTNSLVLTTHGPRQANSYQKRWTNFTISKRIQKRQASLASLAYSQRNKSLPEEPVTKSSKSHSQNLEVPVETSDPFADQEQEEREDDQILHEYASILDGLDKESLP